MKKLTLILTSTLLAIACVANAENCPSSTTVTNDSGKALRTTEIPQALSKPLTYVDFLRVKRHIDFNFQRLTSISPAAMQCHLSIDRVNQLFKHYAHEDAEKYLANLKRNSSAAASNFNAESAVRQVTTSWPDPYIIGR